MSNERSDDLLSKALPEGKQYAKTTVGKDLKAVKKVFKRAKDHSHYLMKNSPDHPELNPTLDARGALGSAITALEQLKDLVDERP